MEEGSTYPEKNRIDAAENAGRTHQHEPNAKQTRAQR